MSKYAVVDPATGERVRDYPTATDAQVGAALATANGAHREWSRNSTVAERAVLLRQVGRLHRDRRDELAAGMRREMGKDLQQALGEVDFSAAIYEYYADNAETFLADEPIELLASAGRALVRRSSVGVVLGIMPWNYPYYQVARFAAPNLLVGNTVLLKHASQCPASAESIHEIFADAGFPTGAYSNLFATRDHIATLIADPRVQGVSLTGSERAGAGVAEVAGRHLKKVVLELGGSDPFIVLDAENLDATVDAAYAGRFSNAGQACNAAKRFIVVDDAHDAFVDKFVSKVRASADSLAPLSSLAAAEALAAQVDRAAAAGGKVYTAGDRRGAHFPPAVVTDLAPDAPISREEFFGPVALVFRAADEDEAVALANDTPFGLGSYVFTSDADQGERVADRLDVGMVFINLVQADGVELPFGGVKRSGFGRELGRYGIDEFVNKKLIRAR